MVLTDKEVEQFYDSWISLLDFVNQKFDIKVRLEKRRAFREIGKPFSTLKNSHFKIS